jgi:hypothetical protein
MMSVKNMGTFFIFDREYNIEFAMQDAFAYYFTSKMKKIISQKDEISRPSVILKNIVVGCRVMQSLCNIVSFDLSELLRTFLFDNFCDTTLPPPGSVGTFLNCSTTDLCFANVIIVTVYLKGS